MSSAAAACLQCSAEGDWRLAGWCRATGPHMNQFSSWHSAQTLAAVWAIALKGASNGCAGWHRMPAWRRSTVKPGMMRSSTSSSACRRQSDQSPPPPVLVILVICIRSTGTAKRKKPYLTISLAQKMILVPVSSPTSQPVGCVRVKDAVQVCGVRLMPARHNTGQLGTDLFRMHSMA